jgi:hypothetical protein
MKAYATIIGVGTLPNGTYSGTWSSYSVKFAVGGKEYEAKTVVGIRGKSECKVTVVGKVVWVTT